MKREKEIRSAIGMAEEHLRRGNSEEIIKKVLLCSGFNGAVSDNILLMANLRIKC